MLQMVLTSCRILTTPFPIVQLVHGHGKHNVHCRKRGEEVHKGQTQLLLGWHAIDKQGEGPPESTSTKVTCPSG